MAQKIIFGEPLKYDQAIVKLILFKLQKQPSRCVLGKGVLKICSKFTGEHPCRSVISVKLLCIFTKITYRHECSPVNFRHIFRTPPYKNTSVRMLLQHGLQIALHYLLLFFVAYQAPSFGITDAKPYSIVAALSKNDNAKLLQLKTTIIYQGVNRLLALSFESNSQRAIHRRYFFPTVEIKDYNVMINGRNFFNQPIKHDMRT